MLIKLGSIMKLASFQPSKGYCHPLFTGLASEQGTEQGRLLRAFVQGRQYLESKAVSRSWRVEETPGTNKVSTGKDRPRGCEPSGAK